MKYDTSKLTAPFTVKPLGDTEAEVEIDGNLVRLDRHSVFGMFKTVKVMSGSCVIQQREETILLF